MKPRFKVMAAFLIVALVVVGIGGCSQNQSQQSITIGITGWGSNPEFTRNIEGFKEGLAILEKYGELDLSIVAPQEKKALPKIEIEEKPEKVDKKAQIDKWFNNIKQTRINTEVNKVFPTAESVADFQVILDKHTETIPEDTEPKEVIQGAFEEYIDKKAA